MRPPSPSIPEKEFLNSALKQNLRIDGRIPLDMRTPVFIFGPELGWVDCSLGKTRVVAYVDAKMVKPTPERPFEGMITIHSELSPYGVQRINSPRPSEEEVTITRMLDKIIKRSDALDKESLCILAGQRVWHIRLSLHFLADAGNMVDCACLAGIVALRHFRRPEVEVIGDDEVIVHSPLERAPMPLAIHHSPFCFTFAFFADPETPPILDPTQLEQRLSAGLMSIALNAQKEICVLQKLGGVPQDTEEILRLVKVAVAQAKELSNTVDAKLTADWATRKVEVR
ncbi:ribosomal protein S5 domain 2-type protein [Ephemerocybe angulata]|uniref:Ribosomal protein S5 domain 2-type protein n=1 Tax=Ephemerocybe angulata TaxID=980116 RepID=A0A8H6MA33_9AGAR|nr:ribosomal protein S5 domain 2-type protein [Tulosesus angulatus]